MIGNLIKRSLFTSQLLNNKRKVKVNFIRCAKLATESYLPYNHPIILKHVEGNMYTNNVEELDKVLTTPTSSSTDQNISKLNIECRDSTTRAHLKSQLGEMITAVFFYNETNPHAGMLLNLKQSLYDYFQLVGPVKNSWLKILLKDNELVDLISRHITDDRVQRAHDKMADETDEISAQYHPIPIGEIASLIECLESRKGVSSCKFKNCVIGNLLQLRSSALSRDELIVLQVLAQYAYYEYEII